VLTTRAPGKVNVCLLVGAPRADGLHPLVSIFQPTKLADDVTMEPYVRDVVVCHGVEGENLALKALTEFRAATGWDGAPQRITIEKRIPIAGGMAGGSADAAAVLRLASEASGIAIPPGLPSRLGADVPALLANERALVTGAGEHVRPLPGAHLDLVVVPLNVHLTAAQVYRAFDVLGMARSDEELEALKDDPPIVNDLEPAARRLCRRIEPALEALAHAGAEHPMVTGSGPTVFGRSDDPERVVARLSEHGYRGIAA
jgi:4-diphosphocytidyl-2-C-methyl-D-erythritol kinase